MYETPLLLLFDNHANLYFLLNFNMSHFVASLESIGVKRASFCFEDQTTTWFPCVSKAKIETLTTSSSVRICPEKKSFEGSSGI